MNCCLQLFGSLYSLESVVPAGASERPRLDSPADRFGQDKRGWLIAAGRRFRAAFHNELRTLYSSVQSRKFLTTRKFQFART